MPETIDYLRIIVLVRLQPACNRTTPYMPIPQKQPFCKYCNIRDLKNSQKTQTFHIPYCILCLWAIRFLVQWSSFFMSGPINNSVRITTYQPLIRHRVTQIKAGITWRSWMVRDEFQRPMVTSKTPHCKIETQFVMGRSGVEPPTHGFSV